MDVPSLQVDNKCVKYKIDGGGGGDGENEKNK
jgi:hypothetical protein